MKMEIHVVPANKDITQTVYIVLKKVVSFSSNSRNLNSGTWVAFGNGNEIFISTPCDEFERIMDDYLRSGEE